jgi:hypothetical protein
MFPIEMTFTRTVMLIAVVYCISGPLIFCLVLEDWTLRDCIYFSVVTFTTVGYGDVTPLSSGGKLLTCFYTQFGHVTLTVYLAAYGHKFYSEKMDKLRKSEREGTLRNRDLLASSGEIPGDDTGVSNTARLDPIANPIKGIFTKRYASVSAFIINAQRSLSRKLTERLSGNNSISERILKSAISIVVFFLPSVAFIIMGSVVVGYLEGWSWSDSIYWCTMTGTTVGYGDFSPSKRSTIWFSIFFIPFCVALMGGAIGKTADMYVTKEIKKNMTKLINREITLQDIDEMDQDGDDNVDLMEFVEFFLVRMNKVDKALLQQLHDQFSALDADGSGTLTKEDIDLLDQRKLKEMLDNSAHSPGLRRSEHSYESREKPPDENVHDSFPLPVPEPHLSTPQSPPMIIAKHLISGDIEN